VSTIYRDPLYEQMLEEDWLSATAGVWHSTLEERLQKAVDQRELKLTFGDFESSYYESHLIFEPSRYVLPRPDINWVSHVEKEVSRRLGLIQLKTEPGVYDINDTINARIEIGSLESADEDRIKDILNVTGSELRRCFNYAKFKKAHMKEVMSFLNIDKKTIDNVLTPRSIRMRSSRFIEEVVSTIRDNKFNIRSFDLLFKYADWLYDVVETDREPTYALAMISRLKVLSRNNGVVYSVVE
jgi:hypothetical protein